jgi:endonuclease/exonuclease/phosphatase family metal-dependent hydrolase
MRRSAQLLLAIAFVFSAYGQTSVRVGAWNIEHLGNPCSRVGNCGVSARQCTRRPQRCLQDPADLARYIIASNVDVLGLEEVSQNLEGRRNATLERALAIVRERTGATWRHVLFPKNDQHQHIGVAWNTSRARLIGEPFRVPVRSNVEGQALWDRRPFAVKFSFGQDRTDVVVIVLHMKANRRQDNEPNLRRRAAEARELVRVLPVVREHFDDRDVVLIGDSNILDTNEASSRVYIDAGFRDLNSEDEPTFVSDDGAPFDRTYVPTDQSEFTGVDQVVFDTEFLGPNNLSRQQYRRRFSDHFMIVAELRVRDDDD